MNEPRYNVILGRRFTRRDRCDFIARRAYFCTPPQAAEAWYSLAEQLDAMGEMDIPKFNDLLIAIRVATIKGRQTDPRGVNIDPTVT